MVDNQLWRVPFGQEAYTIHTGLKTGQENEVALIDRTTGRIIKSVVHQSMLKSIAISRERELLAVAGASQTIYLYNSTNLELALKFRAHDQEIEVVRFHPDRPIIVSGTRDGVLKVWDIKEPYWPSIAGFAVLSQKSSSAQTVAKWRAAPTRIEFEYLASRLLSKRFLSLITLADHAPKNLCPLLL